MPLADCVIDLLMDEYGYKYSDKVADRTNDVNWRFPCASPGLAVLLYASWWACIEKHQLTHISPCLGIDLVSYYVVQKQNMDRLICNGQISNVVQKLPFFISKQSQSTVHEKASVVSFLFTFKHSLISYFTTHNQQATNYRVDIPQVLQRFSINCKTHEPSPVFVCACVCI